MSELRKVRTTMRPDDDIEVDETEYRELSSQGLIVDQDEKTQAEQSVETEKLHGNLPASAQAPVPTQASKEGK